ncbi:AtpZ/AtpI family protein [Chitinophaga sp. CF418]|uniref:AtpZ/AtpI family protein n=1 Tax=Chitinophaga sp. CF418 TaxID=1855287 RepID=UPI0009188B7F|nr:Putative F0F1-ATPase subunit Ca2+/Mg2+ transporter [Chitinophaga sp. CF418]
MEDPFSQKKPRKKPDNKLLLKYTGLAFQMMATLGVAVFAGYKIDQRTGWSFPFFLIILSLLALVLILRQIIKDTSRNE